MNLLHVYTCTPILSPLPPPSPPYPSGLFQNISFRCLASCIKLALVIYFTYGNVHVSMLLSQIIPPSPSSIGSKSLFFIFVFPFALPLLTLYKTPFCLKSLGKNAFLCVGKLYSPPIHGLLSLNKGHPTLY